LTGELMSPGIRKLDIANEPIAADAEVDLAFRAWSDNDLRARAGIAFSDGPTKPTRHALDRRTKPRSEGSP
jgi:hypothetical protein